MTDKKTPAEQVLKANDDYHKAIDAVMEDTDIDVTIKVAVGRLASGVFSGFTRINELLVEKEEAVEPVEPILLPE